MDQIAGALNWLFGTREGVFVLLGAGLLISLVVALVLERRGRKTYYNHAKSADDIELFGEDEEGWSDFEDDNV